MNPSIIPPELEERLKEMERGPIGMAQEARRLRQHLLTCSKCIEEMTNDSAEIWESHGLSEPTEPGESQNTCPQCGDDHPSQHPSGFCCMEGHMKQLEAELDQLNKMKEEIEQLNIAGATAVEAAKLFKQRAESAEAEVERMKEQLYDCLSYVSHDPIGASSAISKQLQRGILATLNLTKK